jgi:hypothetical protein
MRCGLCVLYMRKRKSYRENCVAGYFLGAASTVQPQRLLYTTRIKENKLLQAQTHIALNWRGPLFECGSDYNTLQVSSDCNRYIQVFAVYLQPACLSIQTIALHFSSTFKDYSSAPILFLFALKMMQCINQSSLKSLFYCFLSTF